MISTQPDTNISNDMYSNLQEGDFFKCKVESLIPDAEPKVWEGTIRAIRGGGFYGKALIFDDFVIKTTIPDAWHLFWRSANYYSPIFPPQSYESIAQIDHLATRILHLIMPILTDNEIISPDSYGYTHLGPLGYAQVLERMYGRGTRFDRDGENERFQNTREYIWELGVELGIEHAAQVHPNNPFGKPNLWIRDDGQLVWLDVLPAIRHTGFVLPAFYFPFHKDVRTRIGNGDVTFNRIHTQKMRSYMEQHPEAITGSIQKEVNHLLDAFDKSWNTYEQAIQKPHRQRIIEDVKKRNIATPKSIKSLENSYFAYLLHIIMRFIKPILGTIREFIQETLLYRLFYDAQLQEDIKRMLIDKEFRQRKMLEKTAFRGLKKAFDHDLVSQEEWNDAWDTIEERIKRKNLTRLVAIYGFLQMAFLVTSMLINVTSVIIIASALIAENPLARVIFGIFFDWIAPPLVRIVITLIVSVVVRRNLRTVMIFAGLPKVGTYIALPADIGRRFGNRSKLVWHYSKRSMIAMFSKLLRPWGGWNSDLEEKLWKWLKVENW